ncbi:hypothetical protein M3Y97_00154900 [Aphelenchoides bicaudatus]|nr:hypothetical protein M3Y97_00154900 [Aphelenchoides bicaudatus]
MEPVSLFRQSPESASTVASIDEYASRLVSSTNDDGKSCLICGSIAHGFHFGILACRACAGKLDLSSDVPSRKINSTNVAKPCACPIRKDMRNTCRHCRFNKCVALGMNKGDVQMNRDPIGRRRELQPRIVECCSKPSACCDSSGQIRSAEGTDAEMDDLESKAMSSSVSPQAVAQPLPAFPLESLATSVATSNVFSAALANVLPHFNQALQPTIATLPSLIASTAVPQSFLPVVTTSVLPATPITLPVTTAPSLQPANVFQAASIGSFVQPSLAAFAQQQQATMTLLQNATELAAREQQNELRFVAAQTEKPAESPSISLLPFQQPAGPSVLQRLTEGYANYQSSQKSLYTVMNPDNIFSAELYRLVRHSEHVKMERGCLSLMFSMVNDWFQPFNEIDHALKVLVLRAFSTSFSHLDQCYKTMLAFPTMNDSKFVLHYGQYIDNDKLEFFFQEHKDPNIAATVSKNVLTRCRTLTNKMRKLQVRECEIASLAGILLWNEVALASNLDNTDKIRDRIYGELHSNIIMNYGIVETGARMGSLLCLLHDLSIIAKEINDSIFLGKIFNPHALDLFDESS